MGSSDQNQDRDCQQLYFKIRGYQGNTAMKMTQESHEKSWNFECTSSMWDMNLINLNCYENELRRYEDLGKDN